MHRKALRWILSLMVGLLAVTSLSGSPILAIRGADGHFLRAGASSSAALYPGMPYLQNVTEDAVTVMWETADAASGRVRYRRVGASVWQEAAEVAPVTIHAVRLTELRAETAYEYQVDTQGTGAWTPGDAPGTSGDAPAFRTAPAYGATYRVAIYGDSRSAPERHAEVVDAIVASDPDLVFHVGDLVYHGRDHEEWGPQFFAPAAEMLAQTPFFPVLGNHEYRGGGPLWYLDLFDLPDGAGTEKWYAMTYGCSRFIGLDSDETEPGVSFEPGEPQHTWLTGELGSPAFERASWQFVLFHHPPFTSGSHTADETKADEYLAPLFETHGVDMVFNGHNHHYERSLVPDESGIHYVVTGGGGAPLTDFPNGHLNPYSQVRVQDYEFVTLDFDCTAGTAVFNAWNREGVRIDGPITLTDDRYPCYLPLVAAN